MFLEMHFLYMYIYIYILCIFLIAGNMKCLLFTVYVLSACASLALMTFGNMFPRMYSRYLSHFSVENKLPDDSNFGLASQEELQPTPRRNIDGNPKISRATEITQNSEDDKRKGTNHVDEVMSIKQHPFLDMMLKRASKHRLIYLASVDFAYIDMAVNLYETSFKKLGIENYLFAGSDEEVCATLMAMNISCVTYIHEKESHTYSIYGSIAFRRKTHIKTKIVLDGLKLGLTVVLTDVDIVFFKDPQPYFMCNTCGLEIQNNWVDYNSGFFIARPTTGSLRLFEQAWERGVNSTYTSNQRVINKLMRDMGSSLKWKVLNAKQFPNGKKYFTSAGRYFKGEKPCPECVIVHNNWIRGLVEKVYRFKERGLWEVDIDGYYSSLRARYISFELPDIHGRTPTCAKQVDALKAALILGHLLDRIVILPRMRSQHLDTQYSGGAFCPINQFHQSFENKYRESVFLENEKVPGKVKASISPKYLLKTRGFQPVNDTVETLTPHNIKSGPTLDEIHKWFKDSQSHVLRFHSLYISLDEPTIKQRTPDIKLYCTKCR